MKLQSLIKYSYAWNCVNNPTWKVSTFQRTDSVNNTMRLAFSTNHQYVPCVINTNTKRERTGYLRVFLMRTRGITPELQLQALLKCVPMHTSYHQLSRLYRSVSLGNSINHLKHCLARAIREIKHSARGLDANKALGFASCFISISAARLVLYFTYSTRGNALTYT